jgi:hypothetical protein
MRYLGLAARASQHEKKLNMKSAVTLQKLQWSKRKDNKGGTRESAHEYDPEHEINSGVKTVTMSSVKRAVMQLGSTSSKKSGTIQYDCAK